MYSTSIFSYGHVFEERLKNSSKQTPDILQFLEWLKSLILVMNLPLFFVVDAVNDKLFYTSSDFLFSVRLEFHLIC